MKRKNGNGKWYNPEVTDTLRPETRRELIRKEHGPSYWDAYDYCKSVGNYEDAKYFFTAYKKRKPDTYPAVKPYTNGHHPEKPERKPAISHRTPRITKRTPRISKPTPRLR